MLNHIRLTAALCVFLGLFQVQAAEPATTLIVAHRGLLRHAPENTLANFRACLELRLGFEFDVQRTKDGQLVCLHDNMVDRTTNGTGRIDQMSLSQVRELDAGSWFDPKFAGERVPTIDEVLRLLADYRKQDVLVAADLKAEGVEEDVVRLALKWNVLHRVLFIGRTISDSKVRNRISLTAARAQVAVLVGSREEFRSAVSSEKAGWMYLRFLPSSVETRVARTAGKKVFLAGPLVSENLSENWLQAYDAGVDAVLTDYPLEMREVLLAEAAAAKKQ